MIEKMDLENMAYVSLCLYNLRIKDTSSIDIPEGFFYGSWNWFLEKRSYHSQNCINYNLWRDEKKEMLTLCNTQHHYFHKDNVLLQKSSNFEEVYLKNGKKDWNNSKRTFWWHVTITLIEQLIWVESPQSCSEG